MTPQQKVTKIKEINKAVEKLEGLAKERQGVVRGYIKDLEARKADEIRASLGLPDNQ